MMRRIACVGDQLERGGEILPYSGPVFTIGDSGHQVALIGKTAYCEACKSTGIIAKTGGPYRIEFMGETAADGDTVLCRCAMPPKIVARLAESSWCDDMAETMGVVAPASHVDGNNPSTVAHFDDRFILRNADSQPISDAAYAIQRGAGELEYGVTDSQGHTHLLSSTAANENINLYLAG